MRKILFVIPSLEYSGAAKQITLLAEGLPAGRYELRVCALERDGPAGNRLRAAGVPIDVLGATRLVNLPALWRLRRLVRDGRPDVIHTWGPAALRTVALVLPRDAGRLVASVPLPPRFRRKTLSRLDRWLLRRADRLVARSTAEAERCGHLGLPPDRIIPCPPGVESGPGAAVDRPVSPAPPDPFILCAGPLEPHKGLWDAVWAFDILQYLHEELNLGFVGSGPERARLEQFAALTGARHRIHFLGSRPDLPALLDRATLVWIPSLAGEGTSIALEAMAHGRAVVASRLPALAEVVVDGQTGFLVTPGNKVELARQSRLLLNTPALREQMGQAGRERALTHFSAAELVRRFADLYADDAGRLAAGA